MTVGDELAVKWYEMGEIGLPSTALSSFFGPMYCLRDGLKKQDLSELRLLMSEQLPHILHCLEQRKKQKNKEFIMSIYFEHEFETPADDLRDRLGIITFEEYKRRYS